MHALVCLQDKACCMTMSLKHSAEKIAADTHKGDKRSAGQPTLPASTPPDFLHAHLCATLTKDPRRSWWRLVPENMWRVQKDRTQQEVQIGQAYSPSPVAFPAPLFLTLKLYRTCVQVLRPGGYPFLTGVCVSACRLPASLPAMREKEVCVCDGVFLPFCLSASVCLQSGRKR